MRLIDADETKIEIIGNMADFVGSPLEVDMHDEKCNYALSAIDMADTVDAVQVVRCKDCKHFNTDYSYCHQSVWWLAKDANDFCSYGERKDGAR